MNNLEYPLWVLMHDKAIAEIKAVREHDEQRLLAKKSQNVQWRLVNIETSNILATLGEPFSLNLDNLADHIAKSFIGK